MRGNKAGERIWGGVKEVQFLVGWLGKAALKRGIQAETGRRCGRTMWTIGWWGGDPFPAGKAHCKGPVVGRILKMPLTITVPGYFNPNLAINGFLQLGIKSPKSVDLNTERPSLITPAL